MCWMRPGDLSLCTGCSPIPFPASTRQERFPFNNLLRKYSSQPGSKSMTAEFRNYVNRHWRVNTALLDTDWIRGSGSRPDLSHNPFEPDRFFDDTALKRPAVPTRYYDYLSVFFRETAKSISTLAIRIQVEAVHGEFVRDVSHFCQWLIKIRDYIGGHMATFIHAMPILKSYPAACVTSNCLRNTANFPTLEHHSSEY